MNAGSPRLIELEVARRLSSLRRERGWTLRELGRQAELSAAYLSRVENGHAALTLQGLGKLAAALGVSLTAFFADEVPDLPLHVCRANQGVKMRFRGPRGTRVEMLAEPKRGKWMEPLLVEVSTTPTDLPLQGHAGEEFNYVLSGCCELRFGGEVFRLETGDSVYYDASVPHALLPVAGQSCRILAVVTSPDHRFHSNIHRILEDRH